MNHHLTLLGKGIEIFPNVKIDPSCIVGHGSVIGIPSIDDDFSPTSAETQIGAECRIGCFCVVEAGAQLGARVRLDHYVRVGPGTTIGDDTLLLYGTRVHCDVRIGKRCRISGNCPDRTVLEDDVTHFGLIHHDYNAPEVHWDENLEASAHIGRRTVIGARALIIGAVHIGENSYIAAGEIVRKSVPDRCVVYKGQVIPAAEWKGRLSEKGFFK